MQLQIQAQEAMNERLKERLPDVTGGKKKIFLIFFIIFFNYFMLGEPLYANVSKDTRLALLANTENAKSIYFYCIFWGENLLRPLLIP